jgi:hypothetical protein
MSFYIPAAESTNFQDNALVLVSFRHLKKIFNLIIIFALYYTEQLMAYLPYY